jgi:predicted deacylase
MEDILSLYPDTYEASRERFRQNLAVIQSKWPAAELSGHRLPGDEGLTIDWIRSNALEKNEKVLVMTTAEHGIEGYVGSAMLQRFIDKFLPSLDPSTTGLLFVHAINPWGMKQHRRVNADNIDLNRTFLYDQAFDPDFNPEYDFLNDYINPVRSMSSLALSNANFYLNLIRRAISKGLPWLKHHLLLGQYRFPHSIYYGGTEYPEETRTLMDLYRQAFRMYDQVLHLDMHTGYGPRYQMSLVNSVFETTTSKEFVEKFNYPLVVAANREEFYALRGDMIDYVYALREHEFPGKKLYATSFEFGTLGDGLRGQIGSPRAMVFENRLRWQGATSERIARKVKGDFEELFNPAASHWRRKAVADADRAFEGILKAECFLDGVARH